MTPSFGMFNWYFGRRALPYWCVIIFDLTICFAAALFILLMRHPLSMLVENRIPLLCTLCTFGVFNLVGFRVFHTYAGILRYSQFIDLLRVAGASLLSLVIALVFDQCISMFGWNNYFYELTGRMTVVVYLGSTTLLCASRVLIKTAFDNAMVGRTAQNALIYGTHAGALSMTNDAINTKPVHFLIKGYIGDKQAHYKERIMGKRIYSTQEDLRSIIIKNHIQALLVSPLKHDLFVHNQEFQDMLIELGVKIYIAQNAEEWNVHQSEKEKVQLRQVKIEDLLSRDEIQVDMESVGALLRGKKVMITGSAGSIGSEMVRQIATYHPAEMMLIDQAETPQHDIRLMMAKQYPDIQAHTVVTSICKEDRMEEIFRTFRPDYVFHAAAYKHVPMMEDNPSESVQNNVWGTKVIADLSLHHISCQCQILNPLSEARY